MYPSFCLDVRYYVISGEYNGGQIHFDQAEIPCDSLLIVLWCFVAENSAHIRLVEDDGFPRTQSEFQVLAA